MIMMGMKLPSSNHQKIDISCFFLAEKILHHLRLRCKWDKMPTSTSEREIKSSRDRFFTPVGLASSAQQQVDSMQSVTSGTRVTRVTRVTNGFSTNVLALVSQQILTF